MDIKEFCSIQRHEKRPYCIQPWNCGGFTIATDTRILVAVPEIEGYPDGRIIKAPMNAIDILSECEKISFRHFDLNIKPGGVCCTVCHGFGRMNVETCQDCNGVGEVTFSTDRHVYDFECKECGGNGEYIYPSSDGSFVCQYCYGIGYTNENIIINNRPFAFHYIMKISTLPGLQIGPSANGNKILFFKADNGLRGALMGLRKDDD